MNKVFKENNKCITSQALLKKRCSSEIDGLLPHKVDEDRIRWSV
jgi:hypothetical protein